MRKPAGRSAGMRAAACRNAEIVLAPQAADIAHPAFSKLFVETEYLADVGAIGRAMAGH